MTPPASIMGMGNDMFSHRGNNPPPDQVVNFSAVANGDTQIDLSWNAVDGADSYEIDVSTDGGANYSAFSTPGALDTSDSHAGLTEVTTRHYRIRAIGPGGEGEYAFANATTTPGPVLNFAAVASSDTQIDLTWDDNAREDAYELDVSTDGGTNYAPLIELAEDVVSHSHAGLSEAVTRHYRIRAMASGVPGPYSFANATTLLLAPANFTATADGSDTITLGWIDTAADEGYELDVSTNGGVDYSALDTPPDNAIGYTHTPLPGSTTRHYRLRKLHSVVGPGPYSFANATTAAAGPNFVLARTTTQVILVPLDGSTETAYDDGTVNAQEAAGAVYDPVNDRIAFEAGGQYVYVMDTDGNNVKQVYDTGNGSHHIVGLYYEPDEGKIWCSIADSGVTNNKIGYFTSINTDSWGLTAVRTGGTASAIRFGMVVDIDGDSILAGAGNWDLCVFSPIDPIAIESFRTTTNPTKVFGVCADKVNEYIYWHEGDTRSVRRVTYDAISTDTTILDQTGTPGVLSNCLDYWEESDLIIFADSSAGIVSIDPTVTGQDENDWTVINASVTTAVGIHLATLP